MNDLIILPKQDAFYSTHNRESVREEKVQQHKNRFGSTAGCPLIPEWRPKEERKGKEKMKRQTIKALEVKGREEKTAWVMN